MEKPIIASMRLFLKYLKQISYVFFFFLKNLKQILSVLFFFLLLFV